MVLLPLLHSAPGGPTVGGATQEKPRRGCWGRGGHGHCQALPLTGATSSLLCRLLAVPLSSFLSPEHCLSLNPDKDSCGCFWKSGPDNYSVLPNGLECPSPGVQTGRCPLRRRVAPGEPVQGQDLMGERASCSVWGLVVEGMEGNGRKSSLGGAGETFVSSPRGCGGRGSGRLGAAWQLALGCGERQKGQISV